MTDRLATRTRRFPFLIAAAVAATVGMTAPASASAAPVGDVATAVSTQSSSFWEVPERRVYGNDPWPFAGECRAWSNATYDTASNTLHVVSRATSTSAISACRIRARLTLHLSFLGYSFEENLGRDVPTACSTTDLSCPGNPPAGVPGQGTGWDDFTKSFPAGMTLTSVTDYDVERRA